MKSDELVDHVITLFTRLNEERTNFASQWDEVAQLIRPNSFNTFQYGNMNTPGQKKTQNQVDATGMMALSRFGAILDSLLTPRNQMWHSLSAIDENLLKDRSVRLWFEQVTKLLFRLRYAHTANFASQNQQTYQELGAFGTGNLFVDKYEGVDGSLGFRYKSLPVGEVFLIENHQGMVIGMIRWFRLKPSQAVRQFGDALPQSIKEAHNQQSQAYYDFLHYVAPNDDYDGTRVDNKGMLYKSCYIAMADKTLLSEGGYNSLPIVVTRYEQAPGETYGRSPAMMVLPALKTLNAEKATFLKQGHRAADPVLLVPDDGLLNVNLRPGALNLGGVTADGKELIKVLPTGGIQISKEMMDEERALINDAFLVTLFQILTETPTMTATEVVERTNEKGILLAPTIGRQQSEYLGPLIERELNLAGEMGLLPPMPPLLIEARGEYQPIYTSPLSRAMRAQEVAGAMRTIETVIGIVNVTQDTSLLDNFNFDVIVPEIAEISGVPESWMASAEEVAEKRSLRAQEMEEQKRIQAAPAMAAMMKTQNETQSPS